MKITITYRFIVGIDVSKKHLDIYILDRKTTQSYPMKVENTREGFSQLAEKLSDLDPERSQTLLVSEHTGRYGEHLLRWTSQTNWPHSLVNTTALDKVGNEHHRKSDPFDAKGLAEYGLRYVDKLRLCTVSASRLKAPKSAAAQLKRLRSERRAMVDRRAGLKGKLSEASTHDADMKMLITMWKNQIKQLTSDIEQIEERIDQLIDQDPDLREYSHIMQTAPGMGSVLNALWLGLFAGEEQLNPRKISSRFGFAPYEYDSGSSVKKPKRSSGYGKPEMRRVMYHPARSVATHKPHYQNYYQRKIAEGKHENVVINNIINKLIRLYCAMWNNRAEYDPNYIQKMKQKWKQSA